MGLPYCRTIGVVPGGSVWGGSPNWQSQTGRVESQTSNGEVHRDRGARRRAAGEKTDKTEESRPTLTSELHAARMLISG